jgi:putative peptidoglycan lipid II flippase
MLAGLAVLGQFTSILREATIAYRLGATLGADTFIAAYLPIDTFTSAFLLSIPFAVLPLVIRYREERGREAATNALRKMQRSTTAGACFTAIMVGLLAPSVIRLTGPDLTSSQATAAAGLLYLMLPGMVFACLSAFLTAQLYSEDRFVYAGLNAVLLNGAVVTAGLLLWRIAGTQAFAIGVTLGFFLQFLLQAGVTNMGPTAVGAQTVLPVISDYIGMVCPVFVFYFMGGAMAMIPRHFSSYLGPGQLAVLSYSHRCITSIFLLGVNAISYPYFPHFVRLIVAKELNDSKLVLQSMIRAAVSFSLPAIGAVIILREPLVRVLYFRGAFTVYDVASVSSTLVYLSPLILGSLMIDVMARCLIAMRKVWLCCGLYAILLISAYVASNGFRTTLKGISFAWSLSFWLSAPSFIIAINYLLGGEILKGLWSDLLRVMLSSAVATFVMMETAYFVTLHGSESTVRDIVTIIAALFIGTVSYCSLAWFLQVPEMRMLLRLSSEKLGLLSGSWRRSAYTPFSRRENH